MRVVKRVNRLKIMKLNKRDLEYREDLPAEQYIILDEDDIEVGVDVEDSLEVCIEFARAYEHEEE